GWARLIPICFSIARVFRRSARTTVRMPSIIWAIVRCSAAAPGRCAKGFVMIAPFVGGDGWLDLVLDDATRCTRSCTNETAPQTKSAGPLVSLCSTLYAYGT